MMVKGKVVDLFCGGGGSAAGYHMAGMETVWAADQAEHCVNTFRANFGNVIHRTDISRVHSLDILGEIQESPDLVVASPPCEPYTSANERRIEDPFARMFVDDVGRLMVEAVRLIGDLEPTHYVIENVVGILDGESQYLLTEEFKRLGLPRPHFNVIQAEDWGIPSRRKRVFISDVKLKTPHVSPQSVMDVIGDLPDPRLPHGIPDHEFVEPADKYVKKIPFTYPGQGLVYFRGSRKQHTNMLRLKVNEPADVVMGLSKFIHPIEDRLLTVREHARLMTFPDSHRFLGSIAQRYDMAGEAVPSLLMKQIVEQLFSSS